MRNIQLQVKCNTHTLNDCIAIILQEENRIRKYKKKK